MPDKREDTVATPALDYSCQADTWLMIHDLLGGTKTMRAAGERWLPREEKEEEGAYGARLCRSFLYNGFSNTVDRLTAKPFSRPITRQGDVDERLASIEQNMDKAGTTIDEFARSVFKSALKYGRAHALVDFTQIPAGSTAADEQKLGARPTIVLVEAPDLIGWLSEVGPNGLELTQVRIRECRKEKAGTYIDEEVEYIRVITKTDWELWKKGKNAKGEEEWIRTEQGTHTFGAVPLFTFYMVQEGFMMAKCPLEDLAWVNIRHWQSSSEQNNVLRIVRIGILFGKGFTEEEAEKGLVIGPNHAIISESKDANLEFVEHTGSAIKAGQEDVDKLETRMEVLGLKPLIERSSNSTFGGKLVDEMSTHSNIQSWVRLLEGFLHECMSAAAKWLRTTLAANVKYDIYSDFGLAAADSVHLDMLLKACIAGKISDKTFLIEYQRRMVLSENLDVETEASDLKAAADAAHQKELDLAKIGKSPAKQPEPSAPSA